MALPRISIPEDPKLFARLVGVSKGLIRLHTEHEALDPWEPAYLRVVESGGPEDPYECYCVDRMKLDSGCA